MTTTDTLTQRIHAKADAELSQRIRKPLDELNRATGYLEVPVQGKEYAENLQKVTDRFHAVIVTAMREKNREAAVAAFIAKVDSLAEEVEELRNEIQS